MGRTKIVFPREVLLVEIERRCLAPECGARTHLGLTKEEAQGYIGFECERCKEWNEDALSERDVPEWWEELQVTGLHALRETRPAQPFEPGEVITRLSADFRRTRNEN